MPSQWVNRRNLFPALRVFSVLRCAVFSGIVVMNDPARRVFEQTSRLAFAAVAVVLGLFSLAMTLYGVGQSVHALYTWQDFGSAVLRGVGYIIIAIAVFEVAKYIVEEELVHEREMRSAAEARRSLTKFVSTIAIAVFLEGLVTVFRVSHANVQDLIYPSLLLFAAVVMILGLGAFQRLSATVEQEVGKEDERQNAAAARRRR
jgi:putative Mn2+ efflux pump MntP